MKTISDRKLKAMRRLALETIEGPDFKGKTPIEIRVRNIAKFLLETTLVLIDQKLMEK